MKLLLATVAVCMALLCNTNAQRMECQEGALLYSANLEESIVFPPDDDTDGFTVSPVVKLYNQDGTDNAKGVVQITLPKKDPSINHAIKLVLYYDEDTVSGRGIHVSDSRAATAQVDPPFQFAEIFNFNRDLRVHTRDQEEVPFAVEEEYIARKVETELVIGNQYAWIQSGGIESLREYYSTGLFRLSGKQSESYITVAMNRAIKGTSKSSIDDGLKQIEIFACQPN